MRKNRARFTCQYCHKEFDVPFSETYRRKAGVKYCSLTCYHAARWGHTGKCAVCGKPADTKYCSDECRKNYWNKGDWKRRYKAGFWKKKIMLIEELGGKCSQCGIPDIRVLDIHHIDASKKLTPKKRQYNQHNRLKDWSANKGNIIILCANCHRVHTWEQMGYGVGLPDVLALEKEGVAN